jgi:hypothetical protein
MKLQEIIERAQTDENFASRLKAQATRALVKQELELTLGKNL